MDLEITGILRIPEGERTSATMAGLAEGVRWRVSAKGRRYMVAALSDRSGQFEATVFDEEQPMAADPRADQALREGLERVACPQVGAAFDARVLAAVARPVGWRPRLVPLSWRSFRDAPWYGAVPTLTAAATATERIRLGALVTSVNPRSPITA